MPKIDIIIIGFGNVGQSLAEMLETRRIELKEKHCLNIKVTAIIDSKGAATSKNGINLKEAIKTKKKTGTVATIKKYGKPGASALEILEEAAGDIIVEVTPTNLENGEPGLTHIKRALSQGIHVVTANKGPLALHLPELTDLAYKKEAILKFSGAVGAATPILEFAERCLHDDKIESIKGILNGTTNYILWKMANDKISREKAIKEAIQKGYAERNIKYDIEGLDTASKLVILANHIMKRRISLKDVKVKGINEISLKEILDAEEKGYSIRLIGQINKEIKVQPEKIQKNNPLCVHSALNAIEIECLYSGKHILIGKGAGGKETASSIIKDIIEISKDTNFKKEKIQPIKDTPHIIPQLLSSIKDIKK